MRITKSNILLSAFTAVAFAVTGLCLQRTLDQDNQKYLLDNGFLRQPVQANDISPNPG